MPRLDLVLLLGLGPDAHVASLFPGQKTLNVRDRLAVGVEQAGLEPYVPRVSLTLPVLNAARSVVFLVAGKDKADAVERAFGPDVEPNRDAPGSLVRPVDGELILLLDEAAASLASTEWARGGPSVRTSVEEYSGHSPFPPIADYAFLSDCEAICAGGARAATSSGCACPGWTARACSARSSTATPAASGSGRPT